MARGATHNLRGGLGRKEVNRAKNRQDKRPQCKPQGKKKSSLLCLSKLPVVVSSVGRRSKEPGGMVNAEHTDIIEKGKLGILVPCKH